MSARDELAKAVFVAGSYGAEADAVADWNLLSKRTLQPETRALSAQYRIADAILAAGYTKPRTIGSPAELEALAFGSAVLTSDESDTVVLRCEGSNFRNQSGADLSATDLWRYGTHPLTVLWEPIA